MMPDLPGDEQSIGGGWGNYYYSAIDVLLSIGLRGEWRRGFVFVDGRSYKQLSRRACVGAKWSVVIDLGQIATEFQLCVLFETNVDSASQ